MDNIDEVTDVRLKALKEIEKDKARVVKAYNKKVRSKSFQVGELVWKNHTTNWIEEQLVWQVVTELGRSLQSGQSYIRKFIYARDIARRTSHESIQREVLERVLFKCLARSLSALQTMADVYIALSH